MNEFLDSVARAFARNARGLPAFEVALAVLGLLVLALVTLRQLGRRLARRRQFQRAAAEHGLSPGDRREAARLARQVGAQPAALLDRREIFERATARALAEGARAGVAEAIHRLRHALGFDRLPSSGPLLGSRELVPGMAVRAAGRAGQVLEVGETAFTVLLAGPAGLATGSAVELAFGHRREARYQMRCRLEEVRPGPAHAERLVLAHDEAPVRIQERSLFRVPADGKVRIAPLPPGEGPAGLPPDGVVSDLIDLSAGGALVSSATRLVTGQRVLVWLAVGRFQFAELRAVVLGVEPGAGGALRTHLAFRDLAPAERERLVAAVTRLELEARAEQLS